MNKFVAQLLVVLGLILTSVITHGAGQKKSGLLCEKLLAQTAGFDPYGGFEVAREREELGDLAVASGLPYFYMVVPIAKLPQLLNARYLPDFQSETPRTARTAILNLVNHHSIGRPIATELGGLNILFRDDAKIDSLPSHNHASANRRRVEPNVNLNAMVLYSPRVLGLLTWHLGSSTWLGKDRFLDQPEIPTLCRGWGCISSSSLREKVIEDFMGLGEAEGRSLKRTVLRIEGGGLPSYEIIGIVIQTANEAYANNVLDADPSLAIWKDKRLIYSNVFPGIEAPKVPYLKKHLRAVIEDINPSVHNKEIMTAEPAFAYSSEFGQQVRDLFSSGAVKPEITQLKDAVHGVQGMGVSENNQHFFDEIARALSSGGTLYGQEIPALLPNAKLAGYTREKINAIREWELHVLEYASENNGSDIIGLRKMIVLGSTNDGAKGPAPSAPAVWGIGVQDLSGEKIRWIWTP
ncbi:MAG: hypothetical protein AB1540_00610 [Bdellovibrionota bacterium]